MIEVTSDCYYYHYLVYNTVYFPFLRAFFQGLCRFNNGFGQFL